MKIQTKFSINDLVFGIIIKENLEEFTISCSKCGKPDVVTHNQKRWEPTVGSAIWHISVNIYKDEKIRTLYHVGGGYAFSEDNLFHSLKEAQRECDIRNNAPYGVIDEHGNKI